jgi:Zn-dependent protease
MTSLAFAIYFLRGGLLEGDFTLLGFALVFIIAAVTGGIGFLLHELGHKVVAHRYGVHGEFRANRQMLVVSLIIAMFGVLFAAPGAVWMPGLVSKKESGVIAAAGPVVNMLLALCFLPLAVFGSGVLGLIGGIGMLLNALLGVFNLIPIFGFDGEKIVRWSGWWYALLVAVGGTILVGAYLV